MLGTCVFLLLASYYAMKTSREGFILARGSLGLSGQELQAYASAVMAGLLLLAVPAYGALAARVRRLRLIDISYALVIASLVIFYTLALTGRAVGLPLFIWIGLINVFLVAQFWSYAADLYNEDTGRRLFPVIALGGSLGGIVGPRLASFASTANLLLVSAFLLVPCVALLHVVERCHPHDPHARTPIGGRSGFHIVWRDRYLTLIAALVFVGALVKTIGDFVLSDSAANHAAELVPYTIPMSHAMVTSAREELIKGFYGDFFFWVNLVSFLIQALLVSLAIDRLGVRRALFVMPLIALGVYGAIGAIGGLALVRAAKVMENGTDYSLENTIRQLLFLPTKRSVKYKAKAAIDTFVVRAGDALAAVLIGAGIHVIGRQMRGFAFVNVGLVVVWLAVATGIAQRHQLFDARTA